MKKLFILFVIAYHPLLSQNDASEYIGRILPAKVMYFSSPLVHEVQMRYETNKVFSDRNSEFLINDKKVKSELIEAFTADRWTWTRKFNPNPTVGAAVVDALAGKDENLTMARVDMQGAIESYVIFQKGIGSGTIETPYMRKRDGKAHNVTFFEAEQLFREWVSDSPEIKRELQQADSIVASNRLKIAELKRNDSVHRIQKGLEPKRKGLVASLQDADEEQKLKNAIARVGHTNVQWSIIVNNYNVWYDKKYPGKVRYFFEDPPVRMPSQYESHLERQIRINTKSAAQLEKEAAQKRYEDLYANRSTSVSPENASAKNNVPIKKETFAAKLDRINADGNKVGVLFILNPVKSKPKPNPNSLSSNAMASSVISEPVYIEGEYFDMSLENLGRDFTEELKTALGRTDIDLINLKNVPYRNAKVLGMETRIDDWWASKYKLVFAYSVDPIIDAEHEGMSGKNKFEATLRFGSSLIVTEYIGGADSKEKDIITQMLNLGFFTSPKLSQEKNISDIKELYEKLTEKIGVPIAEKANTERSASVKKLVEKKLK